MSDMSGDLVPKNLIVMSPINVLSDIVSGCVIVNNAVSFLFVVG